ncbi:MAG: glycosyltransferase [Candidatus Zixiibacteriota bacterium]
MAGPPAMTERPLRVLVLADSRAFHTERYAAELERQGCEVLTASLESGAMPHHALRRRGPIKALHYALGASEVRALFRRSRPDIVNPHFASGYGFLAALADRRSSLPIVLQLWGSDILIGPHKSVFHRHKTKLALESADCVLADSDFILEEASKIGKLRDSRTIAWGIERNYLVYRRANMSLSRPLRILAPRPHEEVYNNMFIIRALADLCNSGEVTLTFPNFGGLLMRFKDEAAHRVSRGVAFYEKLPRPEYLEFVAGHDVYLSAAISDSSPASLLEAMGLGLIPVIGDIPGVREWVTKDSGFLFDLSDVQSLSSVISRILTADQDFEKMRLRNAEMIEQRGIFENNIAETINVFREVIARRSA